MFKCCLSLDLLKISYTYTMYPWLYPPQFPSLSSPCSAHLHVTLCSVSLACMSMGNQSVATPLTKNDAFPSATTSCQWLPSWGGVSGAPLSFHAGQLDLMQICRPLMLLLSFECCHAMSRRQFVTLFPPSCSYSLPQRSLSLAGREQGYAYVSLRMSTQ